TSARRHSRLILLRGDRPPGAQAARAAHPGDESVPGRRAGAARGVLDATQCNGPGGSGEEGRKGNEKGPPRWRGRPRPRDRSLERGRVAAAATTLAAAAATLAARRGAGAAATGTAGRLDLDLAFELLAEQVLQGLLLVILQGLLDPLHRLLGEALDLLLRLGELGLVAAGVAEDLLDVLADVLADLLDVVLLVVGQLQGLLHLGVGEDQQPLPLPLDLLDAGHLLRLEDVLEGLVGVVGDLLQDL